MEIEFNNIILTREIKEITSNLYDIEITKGDVSGNSIEIYYKIKNTYTSYVYYKNIKKRDDDYDNLLEILEKILT